MDRDRYRDRKIYTEIERKDRYIQKQKDMDRCRHRQTQIDTDNYRQTCIKMYKQTDIHREKHTQKETTTKGNKLKVY